MEWTLMLQGDDDQLHHLGNLQMPCRPMLGDTFYWNIEGTSRVMEVAAVFFGVDFVGGKHEASGSCIVTVQFKYKEA